MYCARVWPWKLVEQSWVLAVILFLSAKYYSHSFIVARGSSVWLMQVCQIMSSACYVTTDCLPISDWGGKTNLTVVWVSPVTLKTVQWLTDQRGDVATLVLISCQRADYQLRGTLSVDQARWTSANVQISPQGHLIHKCGACSHYVQCCLLPVVTVEQQFPKVSQLFHILTAKWQGLLFWHRFTAWRSLW